MDGRHEQLDMFAVRSPVPLAPSAPVAPAVVASAAKATAKPAARRAMVRGAGSKPAKEVPAVEAEWTEWDVFTGPQLDTVPPGKKGERILARSAEHAAEIVGLQRGDGRERWAIAAAGMVV